HRFFLEAACEHSYSCRVLRSTPTNSPPPRFDPAALPTELRARAAALIGLGRVLHERRPMDEGNETASLEGGDRASARLLLASALRLRGQLDAIIDHCLERPLPPEAIPVRNGLRLGAVQLLFLDTPSHAAVNSAVELVRAQGWEGLAGLTNAILRRIGRDGR